MTTNISSLGLCIATPEAIQPGEKLELKLQLDEADLFPIRFQAKCCWSHVADGGPGTVGLDLRETNPRALSVLRKYLGQIAPESESGPVKISTAKPHPKQAHNSNPRRLLESFAGALHSLNEDSISLLHRAFLEELNVKNRSNPDQRKDIGPYVILELWLKALLADKPQMGSDLRHVLHETRRRKS